MTNSQGGLSLPGIKCRSNCISEFAEGKERKGPIKTSTTRAITINNVGELEASARQVVGQKGSLR